MWSDLPQSGRNNNRESTLARRTEINPLEDHRLSLIVIIGVVVKNRRADTCAKSILFLLRFF